MPTRLKTARLDRHWSQTKLIAAMRAQARLYGAELASVKSLTTELSRWENGHVVPHELHARLLREVFGMTDAELGIEQRSDTVIVESSVDELVRELRAARAVDAAHLALLQRQTDGFRMLDRPLGAARILEQMRAHVANLDQLLKHLVVPAQRRQLARVLADTAALAGWQALDVGALRQSWLHFEMAKAAAREAGDDALLAYSAAEQAYVLIETGDTATAVDVISGARRDAGSRVPRLLTCWLYAAEGEALAAVGRESGALRSFDTAAARLTDEKHEDLPYVVLSDAHLARWRGNGLARLGRPDALPVLTQALGGMDPEFRRASAGLHCDLAVAHRQGGDEAAASAHARLAAETALEIGSVRQRRRIRLLGLAA